MLHYHGANDELFNVEKLMPLIEQFWVKRGFKGFKFEIEEGLGHFYTTYKSFARMNEFID